MSSSGPKLQKSSTTEKECTFDTAPEGCHSFVGGFGHPLNAKAINMDDLAQYIANWTDLPVVNRTELQRVILSKHGRLASHATATSTTERFGERDFCALP